MVTCLKVRNEERDMTKNELARVVIQSLYAMDSLPSTDNINVLTMARTHTKPRLEEMHKLALRLAQRRDMGS